MSTFRTRPAIPVLTNGVYPGKITDLEVQASQFANGKDRLKWAFVIHAHNHDYEILAWTNTTFHQGDPEYVWACAALGRDLGADVALEESDLLDAPVQIKVTPGTNKKTGLIQYNVDAVLPPKSGENAESGMVGTPVDSEEEVPF